MFGICYRLYWKQRDTSALIYYNKEWPQNTTRIQSGHMEWNSSNGQTHLATSFTISIHLLLALSKLQNGNRNSQNSFNCSDRNSIYNMILTLLAVHKAIIDRLSYIIMPITIFGGFDPKKCLTECVDAFRDLFCLNKINKWLSVWVSPNVGWYHRNEVTNSKETSAKISVSVTIFVTVPLIVAKTVKSGFLNYFSLLACHQALVYIVWNWCLIVKRSVPKFQSWSQFYE